VVETTDDMGEIEGLLEKLSVKAKTMDDFFDASSKRMVEIEKTLNETNLGVSAVVKVTEWLYLGYMDMGPEWNFVAMDQQDHSTVRLSKSSRHIRALCIPCIRDLLIRLADVTDEEIMYLR